MIICGFCAGPCGQPWSCRKVMFGQVVTVRAEPGSSVRRGTINRKPLLALSLLGPALAGRKVGTWTAARQLPMTRRTRDVDEACIGGCGAGKGRKAEEEASRVIRRRRAVL